MGDSCEQSFKLLIQAFSRIVHLSVSQLVLYYQQSVDQYPGSAQNGGGNNPDAHSRGKRNPRSGGPLVYAAHQADLTTVLARSCTSLDFF